MLFALCAASSAKQSSSDNPPTIVKDEQAKTKLLGAHRFSLQWISWDRFGKAAVTDDKGVLLLKGEQRIKGADDYLTIAGVIVSIEAKEFKFRGKIVTKISHINGGKPCLREGEMTFKITGNRKYWRLKEMNNPCEEVVDYVDIYF